MKLALALLLLALPARAASVAPRDTRPPSAQGSSCPLVDGAELSALLELELGVEAPLVRLRCDGDRVELRIFASSRTLDLAATAPRARARLIALAASELRSSLREPNPPPARTKRTEKAMWKKILAVVPVAVTAVAAAPPPSKPEVRVEAAPPSTLKKAPPPAEAPAPELRVEDVFTRVGEEVHAVTEAQRKLLLVLISQTADGDPEKADLLVRLGDLHVEEQRFHRFRARSLDQKIFEAGGNAEELKRTRAAEEKAEQAAMREALKRYLEVARGSYPEYRKMDLVLFDIARILREAKRDDAAREYWKRLLKDHPISRFVPDALLAFADDAFERRDLENAISLYEKITKYPESPLADFARYKIGWCHFNLSKFKEALAAFVDVIERAKTSKAAGRLALEREARKDAVRAYAQIGTPERAWPFFQRIGGEPKMLEQLADLYHQQGKFADAVRVYRQLMVISPSSPKLCAWQLEVTRSTIAQAGARAEPDTIKELERLAALQGRSSDAECRDASAALLRELATVWHKEAQRTTQIETYERAAALYRQYSKAFPNAPDIGQMSFYQAEALYQLNKHCEAAPLYSEVVKKSDKWRDEAAWAAVLSWRMCLKIDETRSPVEAGRSAGGPRPFPEPWRKMIDAFDFYLKHVKTGADRVRVKYHRARAFYEFDHLDEAIAGFTDIARNHQDSPLAVYSANLLFDCWAQKADRAKLREATREFCNAPALTKLDAEFARGCGRIALALLRAEAEQLEAARKFKEAAELHLEGANQHPSSTRIDELYYNAGINYQRANLIGPAIVSFQELMRRKPDSPLAKKAIFLVGRSYQNIAAFEAAAENYEKLAARWPEDRDAASALYTASVLRRGLGDVGRAVEDARQFQSRYGARADLKDAAAALAFAEGDYAKYLRDWGERGGVDRQLIAHVKLGDAAWRASCPVTGEGGACVERRSAPKKTPDACGASVRLVVRARRPELVREAEQHFAAALALAAKKVSDPVRAAEMSHHAAQARMLQADAELEKFLALSLPRSQKQLPAWMKEKTRELERARGKYQSVILTKEAHWAIAAAGRVGQMFQVFAAQLNSSPVPPAPPPPRGADPRSWKDDFKNAYCDQLAGHVAALEDKAEDALKLCLDKSTSLSWFNEWSALCEAELNQIKPRSYPIAAELRAEPRFASARSERVPLQR